MEISEYFSNDLRYDHNIWENELNFYKKELGIFETRLVEMLNREPSRELLRELEQYQNQFIRQKEVVDNVNHKIHLYDDELKGIPAEIMLTDDSNEITKHKELESDIKITRKLYFELRDRFSGYLEKFQL
jgi:hypothetical protein